MAHRPAVGGGRSAVQVDALVGPAYSRCGRAGSNAPDNSVRKSPQVTTHPKKRRRATAAQGKAKLTTTTHGAPPGGGERAERHAVAKTAGTRSPLPASTSRRARPSRFASPSPRTVATRARSRRGVWGGFGHPPPAPPSVMPLCGAAKGRSVYSRAGAPRHGERGSKAAARGTVDKAEELSVLPARRLQGGALYASHADRKTSAEAPAATGTEVTGTQAFSRGGKWTTLRCCQDAPPLSWDGLLAGRRQTPPTRTGRRHPVGPQGSGALEGDGREAEDGA